MDVKIYVFTLYNMRRRTLKHEGSKSKFESLYVYQTYQPKNEYSIEKAQKTLVWWIKNKAKTGKNNLDRNQHKNVNNAKALVNRSDIGGLFISTLTKFELNHRANNFVTIAKGEII